MAERSKNDARTGPQEGGDEDDDTEGDGADAGMTGGDRGELTFSKSHFTRLAGTASATTPDAAAVDEKFIPSVLLAAAARCTNIGAKGLKNSNAPTICRKTVLNILIQRV